MLICIVKVLLLNFKAIDKKLGGFMVTSGAYKIKTDDLLKLESLLTNISDVKNVKVIIETKDSNEEKVHKKGDVKDIDFICFDVEKDIDKVDSLKKVVENKLHNHADIRVLITSEYTYSGSDEQYITEYVGGVWKELGSFF